MVEEDGELEEEEEEEIDGFRWRRGGAAAGTQPPSSSGRAARIPKLRSLRPRGAPREERERKVLGLGFAFSGREGAGSSEVHSTSDSWSSTPAGWSGGGGEKRPRKRSEPGDR